MALFIVTGRHGLDYGGNRKQVINHKPQILENSQMPQESKGGRAVIIGVGQHVHQPKQSGETKDVLELIESAIHKAEEDSQYKNLLKKVDTLFLVNSFSLSNEDPLSEIAQRIDIKPDHSECTWIGASAPQWFANQMKQRISSGQTRLGLICGGEALASKKIASAKDNTRGWDQFLPKKQSWMVGDLRDPITPYEAKYGLLLPINIYPLFENGLRYHEGLSMEQHQREIGEFCSSCSDIAARNQYAWFQKKKTTDEILDISDKNRMISWPYTKNMCSIMDVDQTAALFMTDESYAEELGIPKEKWIYLLGTGNASDIWYVTERENFHSSPSVKVAADAAMLEADVKLEDINYFDLYSCFPIAARMTRNMLGLEKNDPRQLTITGSMPNFGGPGNNYSLHAICTMVEKLRENPQDIGLVQGLSWYISKHSVGIYSSEVRSAKTHPVTDQFYEERLGGLKPTTVVEEASGKAIVETYVLFHDRQGKPVHGVIVGKLKNGNRFLAKTDMGEDDLQSMMREECIGKSGKVFSKDGYNFFKFT